MNRFVQRNGQFGVRHFGLILAKGEAEGLIYVARSRLKVGLKLPLLRVMVANHHGKEDTRLG